MNHTQETIDRLKAQYPEQWAAKRAILGDQLAATVLLQQEEEMKGRDPLAEARGRCLRAAEVVIGHIDKAQRAEVDFHKIREEADREFPGICDDIKLGAVAGSQRMEVEQLQAERDRNLAQLDAVLSQRDKALEAVNESERARGILEERVASLEQQLKAAQEGDAQAQKLAYGTALEFVLNESKSLKEAKEAARKALAPPANEPGADAAPQA